MGKEMLFQALVDDQILTAADLVVIANLPATSGFVNKNFSYYKKIVDLKQRNVANVVFSDYFHSNQDLHDDGMFGIYAANLASIYDKIKDLDLSANEMGVKLQAYLQAIVQDNWDFDYDNDDLNGWMVETLNRFELLVTKIHSSVLTNLWAYLSSLTNGKYQSPVAHLKSLQDSLTYGIDMMPSVTRFSLDHANQFHDQCDQVLGWIDEFSQADSNWIAIQSLGQFELHDYEMVNLAKISLLYRTIKTWQFWYHYCAESENGSEYWQDGITMQKDLGWFIYNLVNELHAKPNINLNK